MDKQKQKKVTCSKRKPAKKPKTRSIVVSIGDKKLVSIRYVNNIPHINIRAYNRDSHERMFSTKRGIMLSRDEWNSLKKQMNDIDPDIKPM